MWQQIGQLEGGTVGGLALATDGEGRATVLAITPAGGFGTADGATWQPLSPDPGPALTDVIAVSPAFAQDRTLFSAGRTGVFRSTDGGQSWRHMLVGETLSIAVSPAYTADRTVFVGTAQDGVLRSEDGGETWGGANSGLLDLATLSVAFSPRFAEDRTAFVGTASALYRTRNGGRAWRETPLGLDGVAIQALAVSSAFKDDKLVLAGTEAHGLMRSTDGGGRFTIVPELAERGISALTLAEDGRTVVVAAGDEVLMSADGGATWTDLPTAPGLVLSLAFLDATSSVLVAGLHRLGAARLSLTDPAAGWMPINSGLRASLLTSVIPSPAFGTDQTLFGLSIDEGVLRSHDGGATWGRCWPEDADPAILSLAVHAEGAAPLLLASTVEQLYRSGDGGRSWDALSADTAPPLSLVLALPRGGAGPSFLGVGMTQVDGRETAGVVLSEDGGLTWRPMGRVGADEAGWSFAVTGVAASPAFWADRTLVARSVGTRADGVSQTRLWRSTDAGRSWSVWFEEDGGEVASLPSTLVMPPSSPSGAAIVMAVGGRVLTPTPGAWERRGGQRRPAWRAANVGAGVASVTALAVPRVEAQGTAAGRTVYAGTNVGPFVSRDGGQSFRPWADGYTGGGIVALAVSPDFATDRTVLAVGVGGSVWKAVDR
ncbi:MAG: hypothetical protein IT305_17115 [Chloroflexi bacterium]|nr:hypothetical protein [Chloroflexota bacterium]